MKIQFVCSVAAIAAAGAVMADSGDPSRVFASNTLQFTVNAQTERSVYGLLSTSDAGEPRIVKGVVRNGRGSLAIYAGGGATLTAVGRMDVVVEDRCNLAVSVFGSSIEAESPFRPEVNDGGTGKSGTSQVPDTPIGTNAKEDGTGKSGTSQDPDTSIGTDAKQDGSGKSGTSQDPDTSIGTDSKQGGTGQSGTSQAADMPLGTGRNEGAKGQSITSSDLAYEAALEDSLEGLDLRHQLSTRLTRASCQ